MWGRLANSSVRTRRLATSSFFIATFAAAFLTVSLSASTILPCPASRAPTRGTMAEESDRERPRSAVGQKVVLTRKGGWIEVEQPVKA
ncbi:hypothetical protein PaG_06387 [Moesziomyces aphidis]|uniref:Uncharacterized protein n=1 Tax=Moesziomyces aphidis TaxID=84754 RepID=W3VD55_MOEAP|nr:hypothetical protein PaG_06387 [Moesziomyces aphidis]